MQVSIVVPYYGGLPKWFPLFLQSAGHNHRVQFFIVTDEKISRALPNNISHIVITRAEIERRVSSVTSSDFRLPYAYKLCDVRPFYGMVFRELLQNSQFWGYCDLDLVFGNISTVLDTGRLDHADFFSADAGPVVGTFCLYRNNDRMNTFAQRIPEYIRKLNSAEYASLDEIELDRALSSASDIRYIRPSQLAESQLSLSGHGRMIGRTAGVMGEPNEFYWSHGRTFIKSPGGKPQEVMYLHFIGLKRSYHWTEYDPAREYMEFSFSSAGFLPWKSPPTRAVAVRAGLRGLTLRSLSKIRAGMAKYFSTAFRHRLKSRLAKIRANR